MEASVPCTAAAEVVVAGPPSKPLPDGLRRVFGGKFRNLRGFTHGGIIDLKSGDGPRLQDCLREKGEVFGVKRPSDSCGGGPMPGAGKLPAS